MIMTKEQLFLKAQSQVAEMLRLVERAVERGERIDEVERELFAQLLTVGRTCLEAFVAAQGDGDVGQEVQRDGRCLRRLEDRHPRRYLSIFGELRIERFVYALRAGQKY